jgi:hypothetical protein
MHALLAGGAAIVGSSANVARQILRPNGPCAWESVADALVSIPVNVDSFHGNPTQVRSDNWPFAGTPYLWFNQRSDGLWSDQSICIPEVTSRQDLPEYYQMRLA